MCSADRCVHDPVVEVNPQDLVLVIARADAFTEWDNATWMARNRLVRAMGLEDEDDVS